MNDESYIRLTIELAKKGIGKVSPNPLVGCVIVKDEKIIGAGFHEKFGGNHAEINALNSTKDNLEGSTLYVNLEPCSHYGKTPPCVDKIIEKKIRRVVIGTLDMNPLVSGRGIKKLKAAGVEVKVGLLEQECIDLNKFFFKYITKKLPYVTLKAAQTIDGKIADAFGNSKWISSLSSRRYVHRLRANYDAVLVGRITVDTDNPSLTVRLVEGRNPKRIILDTNLKTSLKSKIFSQLNNDSLIIITSHDSLKKKDKLKKIKALGIKIIAVNKNKNGFLNLKTALRELAKIGICSILVEGGAQTFSSFLKEKIFDDILLFVPPKILGSGLTTFSDINNGKITSAFKLRYKNVEFLDDDLLIELVKAT